MWKTTKELRSKGTHGKYHYVIKNKYIHIQRIMGTSMGPQQLVHTQCKETNIFNDIDKNTLHCISSYFYYCILVPVIVSAVTKIQVPRDLIAVLTSLLMYSARFKAPLTHSCNCDSVRGLPPGLWTEHSISPWMTTVTAPLDKVSSSFVGSGKRISLKKKTN